MKGAAFQEGLQQMTATSSYAKNKKILSVNSRILYILIMSESLASILAMSDLWCYVSRASCPKTGPQEPSGQGRPPHRATHTEGEIVPRV